MSVIDQPPELAPPTDELLQLIANCVYEVRWFDGTVSAFGLSLNDLSMDSALSDEMRRRGALAFGQIAMEDLPGVDPGCALFWALTSGGIAFAGDERLPAPDPAIRAACRFMLKVFFRDIRDVAPDLARLTSLGWDRSAPFEVLSKVRADLPPRQGLPSTH